KENGQYAKILESLMKFVFCLKMTDAEIKNYCSLLRFCAHLFDVKNIRPLAKHHQPSQIS
ncbi:MAG: hypothetical protein EB053_07080, partial [Chlamydiae bacterium]|nr:hypothetical protein [Chlamydiota bacterium]